MSSVCRREHLGKRQSRKSGNYRTEWGRESYGGALPHDALQDLLEIKDINIKP